MHIQEVMLNIQEETLVLQITLDVIHLVNLIHLKVLVIKIQVLMHKLLKHHIHMVHIQCMVLHLLINFMVVLMEINFITAFIKILHSHLVDIILVIMVWDMHNQKMNIDKNQVNIILLKKVLYKVVLVQVNLLLNPQVLQNKLNQLKVVIINLDQVQVFQKINQVQIIIKMVIWVLHLCLHHHLDIHLWEELIHLNNLNNQHNLHNHLVLKTATIDQVLKK
mmetsp:Transcript_9957/g.17044  ORF Transcript_9957/g.17044 Transcript_9957/m.17044 type:complete len:221 (-) Transcript_9957:90-752(-)